MRRLLAFALTVAALVRVGVSWVRAEILVPTSPIEAIACTRSGSMVPVLAAWGLLEWTFVVILVGLTGAVGLAFLYMVGTLFVNPGRRKRSV
jgi:hypothetical protein